MAVPKCGRGRSHLGETPPPAVLVPARRDTEPSPDYATARRGGQPDYARKLLAGSTANGGSSSWRGTRFGEVDDFKPKG